MFLASHSVITQFLGFMLIVLPIIILFHCLALLAYQLSSFILEQLFYSIV